MNDQFEIGEVVIHKPDADSDAYLLVLDGEDVEIIGGLAIRLAHDGPFLCYDVRHPIAGEFYSAPHELRRRPPAADSHERTYMELWRDMAGKAPQRQGEPA